MAVMHAIDREAGLAEGFFQRAGQLQVVFHQQDAHIGTSLNQPQRNTDIAACFEARETPENAATQPRNFPSIESELKVHPSYDPSRPTAL
ncbi:hypothetical protein GCM10009079_09290 [Ralstonia mannitolilytica]